MSIFIETRDNAIDRWTAANGNEYAYGYDDSGIECPLDDWDIHAGCFIVAKHGDMYGKAVNLDTRAPQFFERVEELQGWKNEGIADPDELEELEELQEELADIFVFEDYPVTVYVSRKWVAENTNATAEEFARDALDTFQQWAEGEVYIVEVIYPDGNTDTVGGVYLDDRRSTRAQIEEML